jgi:hypothetical protein
MLAVFVGGVVPRETSSGSEGGAQRTENMRSEDEYADDCGTHGGDQDAAGRHVFGVSYEGVKLRRRDVGKEFEGGVEGLGCPDGHDGEDDPTPFGGGQHTQASDDEDATGGDGVQPGIVLGSEHEAHAACGAAEALDAGGECEWAGVVKTQAEVPYHVSGWICRIHFCGFLFPSVNLA